MKKILVTGGSGFLGINIVRFLLAKGRQSIRILDVADFCYPEKDSVTFVKGDIRDRVKVAEAMAEVDWVVHTAAALPLYTERDIYTTDVEGTRNLLEVAAKNRVQRFVHISSTAVYGIPEHHPLLETDKLDGVGPYGKAKIMAEEVCVEYRTKGMCIPIIRPKSFVGPERLGVFALLYDWAKDGRGFPLIGNGKNRYQLLDVEDLCEMIWLCLTLNPSVANDTYNIGAKEFTTMREDYQTVLDYAGFGKKISTFPVGPMILMLRLLEFLHLSPIYRWVYETASKDSFVSIEKAEKKLGVAPKYSNKEALLRNYKWYLENLESFAKLSGVSHRVPWNQGILRWLKLLF